MMRRLEPTLKCLKPVGDVCDVLSNIKFEPLK